MSAGGLWTEEYTRDVLEHIRGKIEKAEIVQQPFPYLCITDFFPEALYRMLLDRFPALTPEQAAVDGDKSGIDLLAPANDERLTAAQREAWIPIRDHIYPKACEMLERKLAHLIEERIDELDKMHFFHPGKRPVPAGGPMEDALSGFQLLERSEKFAIVPHIHGPYEYISLLHYLPEDRKNAFAGTEIYPVCQPFDIDVPWHAYPHAPLKALGESTSVPFIPNLALVWISTFRAIHGRSPLAETSIRRYIFAYRLFNADRVDSGVINPADRGPLKVHVEPLLGSAKVLNLWSARFRPAFRKLSFMAKMVAVSVARR